MATTSIGKYKVTRTLAGVGDRHLARRGGGARCQVRLLDLAPSADWEQAEREIAILQQLDEPRLGKTLEVFDHQGRVAVAIEALDGEPLDRLMAVLADKGETLDPKAVWTIGHQVAGALAAAHSASDAEGDLVPLCHGYLSPEQIAIAWNGTVRLDGLGVAPLVGGAGSAGMAAYAAPEQASGGRVTPRGDSYSLAVVLWALLAGEEPAPGEADLETVATGVPEVVRSALATALEPSLGKRRITSMELEQWLGDIADGSGKSALAAAMGVLRRSRVAGGMSSRPPEAAGTRGRPSPERRYPPLRPRQPTLVGTAAADAPLGAPTANLDWLKTGGDSSPEAAEEAAVDEINWGDDEEAETLEAEEEEETLEVAVEPAAKPPPKPAAKPRAPGAPPPGRTRERLSEEDIADAMAQADQRVEDLSALDVPPSTFDVRTDRSDDLSPEPPPAPFDEGAEAEEPSLEDGETPAELAAAIVSSAPPPATARSSREAPSSEPEGAADPVVPQGPAKVSVAEGVVQLGGGDDPPPTADAVEGAGAAPGPEPAPPPRRPAEPDETGDGSPWTPDVPAAEPAPKSVEPPRLSPVAAIVVTLVTAVLTMVVGVWWVRHRATIEPTAAPASSAPARPSARSSARRASPSSILSAAATARPSASATAGASAAPSGDPAAPPDDGKDGSALPPTKGYLVVTFRGDPHAEVYSAGQKLGPANQKIEASCQHPAFLRVGAPMPGGAIRWLTDGRPGVKIACQSVTKLTMTP